MPPAAIAVGLSSYLEVRRQESDCVQAWDFSPSTKQMVLSQKDLSLDGFSLLGSLE